MTPQNQAEVSHRGGREQEGSGTALVWGTLGQLDKQSFWSMGRGGGKRGARAATWGLPWKPR